MIATEYNTRQAQRALEEKNKRAAIHAAKKADRQAQFPLGSEVYFDLFHVNGQGSKHKIIKDVVDGYTSTGSIKVASTVYGAINVDQPLRKDQAVKAVQSMLEDAEALAASLKADLNAWA